MSGRIGILTLALLLLPGCSGAGDYDAAGIVAYSRIQGRTYVLLAEHPGTDRGWGTFGGNREPGESLEETAAREFREETRCVYGHFPSPDDLAGLPTVSPGNFLSYVIEVPFVPSQVFESLEAMEACAGSAFEERGPWAWIPVETLQLTIQEGDSTNHYDLPARYVPEGATTLFWDKSATVIERALEEGLLPLGEVPVERETQTSRP